MVTQHTSPKKSWNWTTRLFLTLSVISLFFGILTSYNYLYLKKDISNKIKNQINLEGENSIIKISQKLSQTSTIAEKLASELSTAKLSQNEIEKRLKQELKDYPYIHGLGIAFEPFAFSKTTRLYAPYFIRTDKNKILFKNIKQLYDYTTSSLPSRTGWYQNPLKKGAMWNEPYFGTTSQAVLAEYAVPFYAPEDKEKTKPIGIVFINYDLGQIKKLISSLNFGRTGYGFLISRSGIILSHPTEKYFKEQKTIFEIAKEDKNSYLDDLGKKMIKGESEIADFSDIITKKDCWLAFKPIPTTGWSLCYVFFKDEVFAKYASQLRRKEIIILMSIIFLLVFLTIFTACRYFVKTKTLWFCATIISLLFALGITVIWKLTFKINIFEDITSHVVIGNTDTKNFLLQSNIKEEIKVPMGIFVIHIEFQNLDHVILVGSLWVKFPKDMDPNISREVVFPKSMGTYKETVESYRYIKGNEEVIGYDFRCNIPQRLKYKKFPFDYKNITLLIKPKDQTNKIILVPNFDSYPLINPKSLPGIQQYLEVKGWDINQSFFSYKIPHYKTDFGVREYHKNNPLLYFNVVLRRKFLQPFVSHILPLIVAFFLLFIGLTMVTQKFFFFVLNSTTGLFFALVLAHISLRNTLPTHEFFYLEYFYVLSYLVVITTILNLVMRFKFRTKFKSIHYKNNLIPKLLYWPVILMLLLLITAYSFY